ncbi:acylneuraminate cytidylyltransferase family protein [Tepidibacter aestuarii]|uniref:acylneuraminate cytidylyltransferase family protein n=1 Tax=Tepidibacter aestuarii TaxID=2925782 RepID=UPI0020BF0746|nr:acylneuraminate cytidylyltransferase family protein [Tepidibacter aestuarii]CAH2211896.1 CMP-N,N'-diacetyllegionaminic acid synthase [Tepidibacter aestuarii]
MKKILAIIPARGGSKGVPRKNIKHLYGKHLIGWTIEAAKKSKYIDRLIVSTEDKEIAEVSKKYGCEIPFLRPKELAKDDTSGIDPVIHAVNCMKNDYGYNPDYVMLLQCTSPLRNEKQIDESIELILENENSESLISITEVEHNPYWNKKIDKNGFLKDFIEYDKSKFVRRQDFKKIYRLNGAIYIAKTDLLIRQKSFDTKFTIPYIMDKKSSIDIDTIEDFELAEFYISKLNNSF